MNDILDPDFCPLVAEYERLLKASGQDAAHEYLSDQLRAGTRSAKLDNIIADIIDPRVRSKRGRPSGSSLGPIWHEIGRDYEHLVRAGNTGKAASEALADEYAISERMIQKADKDYRRDMQEALEKIDGWEEEFSKWSPDEQRRYQEDVNKEIREQEAQLDRGAYDVQDGWDEEIKAAMVACPHGCADGCRRDRLLENRHLCPFSPSPRNKIRI